MPLLPRRAIACVVAFIVAAGCGAPDPEPLDVLAAASTEVDASSSGDDATQTEPTAVPSDPADADADADADAAVDVDGGTAAADSPQEPEAVSGSVDDPAPITADVLVVETRPHDPAAFTQGFELHDGRLFETRGRFDAQALTEIDPATGQVLRSASLPDEVFAEGLTVVGDEIIVLSWKAETAFVFDLESFERTGTFGYAGQGWGLCATDDALVMSNGTPTLSMRSLDDFTEMSTVDVTFQGQAVQDLNELECVGDRVYANVWRQDAIVVIDPSTGEVETVIDASGLLDAGVAAGLDTTAVLNGIAYDAERGTFLLTGKLWPSMFEVTFAG